MPNPTKRLTRDFTQSLATLGVPKKEQALPLLYAKIFLRRAVEEDGRRSLSELQSDTLKEILDSFESHREMFHALVLNQVLINPEMNIVIPDN